VEENMPFPESGDLAPVTTFRHSNKLKLEYVDNLMIPASSWSKCKLMNTRI